MGKPRLLSRLALFASFFAFTVIGLGAFTRLIDAGLGCPDWPGCYGRITVPLTEKAQELAAFLYPMTHLVAYKAWAEMIHRYFVGGLSCLILILIVIIFSKKVFRTRGNILLSVGLILLLMYQIALGAWTVTLKLLPVIVTQHLLGGFLILTLLWLIFLNNRQNYFATRNYFHLIPWAVIGILILFFQIALGAWTSTHYASLSCPDFPFCHNDQSLTWQLKDAFNLFQPIGINYEGGTLPDSVRQTIQMVHRTVAGIFALYTFIFAAIILVRARVSNEIMKTLYLILGLILIQVCLGITNVLFQLPLATAILHNLVAALLVLAWVTLLFKLIYIPNETIA